MADVLYGKVNPGGKLPVSFPRNVGQVPIFYNHKPTGRPCDVGSRVQLAPPRHPELRAALRVRLRPELHHVRGLEPAAERDQGGRAARERQVSADVTNTGTRAGDEVAQLYLNDPVASISQPVRRLRGFERVTLQPGQTKTVSWTLDRDDVGYYDNRGRLVVENGRIDLYAGNTSSQADNKRSFVVTGGRRADTGNPGADN